MAKICFLDNMTAPEDAGFVFWFGFFFGKWGWEMEDFNK